MVEARVVVRPLRDDDESAWEGYVGRHPRATVFHRLAWKRVLETFPYRDRYRMAWKGERAVGILPLFECRTLTSRSALYSLPHSIYGGPIGDDAAAEKALIDDALALADRSGADDLVLRNRHPNLLDLPALRGFATFEKAVPGAERDILRSFNKGARHSARRALDRHGLTTELTRDVDAIYELVLSSYRRLGTPVYPRRLFHAIVGQFERDAVLLLVTRRGRPVAAELALRFRDLLTSVFAGEAAGARDLGANHVKYLRLLEWAGAEGIERFNFGRSRRSNPGVVAFKSHLGFEAIDLPYQVVSRRTRPWTPDPNRGGFRLASQAWRYLPGPLARRAGPALIHLFP